MPNAEWTPLTRRGERGGGGGVGGGGRVTSGYFWSFIYKSRRIGSVKYFLLKKGANHIPGSAEKEGHSARTSVLCPHI